MRVLTLIATLVLTTGITLPAYALRCGNHLILEGDTRLRVQAYCGDPSDAIHYYDYSPPSVYYYPMGSGSGDLIEKWTYNLGSTRFMSTLTFRNGYLESIEDDGYGF